MSSRSFAVHVTFALAGIVAGSNATRAYAHGRLPRDTPIDRLVKNLDARLEKAPDDPELHYVVGRLHALAFETRNGKVPVWPNAHSGRAVDPIGSISLPETKYWVGKRIHTDLEAQPPTAEDLHEHLRKAILHLNRAIELAPAIASYHLALASILESGEPMAVEIDVSPLCPVRGIEPLPIDSWILRAITRCAYDEESRNRIEWELRHPAGFGWRNPGNRDQFVTRLDRERNSDDPDRRGVVRNLLVEDWKEQITHQLFVAFALALPSEGSAATQPAIGWATREAYVSYEAGSAYVRIVSARGARPDEAVRLATAKAAIAAFDGLPSTHSVTPIIFSISGSRPLADLLDPGATSTFDLDGSGHSQRWPWVAHDTGILVWDPLKSGRITSGRQLFGSVSWWLFFKNGYDALAALDDDGDGELSGRELDGLAVWFDRNGNGQSDPGEVVPVGELGITGLSCRATERSDKSPCNPRGLRLSTGAILPTYDWITRPLPKAPAVSGAPGTAAPRSGA